MVWQGANRRCRSVFSRFALMAITVVVSVVETSAVRAESLLIERSHWQDKHPPTETFLKSMPSQLDKTPVEPKPVRPVWKSVFQDQFWQVECRNDPQEDSPPQEEWAVKANQKCRMTNNVRASDVEIRKDPFAISMERVRLQGESRTATVAIIRTPMNLLLPGGLTLQVDGGRTQRLAIRSCHVDLRTDNQPPGFGGDHVGQKIEAVCLAPFRLTDALRRALQRGNQLKLGATSLSGDKIAQTISLIGFTKALAALQ